MPPGQRRGELRRKGEGVARFEDGAGADGERDDEGVDRLALERQERPVRWSAVGPLERREDICLAGVDVGKMHPEARVDTVPLDRVDRVAVHGATELELEVPGQVALGSHAGLEPVELPEA